MISPVSALLVAASLSLVLLIGPRWVLSRTGGTVGPSAVPDDLVTGSVLVMVTAEALVVLRLFEWLGLVVAALALAAFCRWRARRLRTATVLDVLAGQGRALLYLLEAASSAGNERVKHAVRRWWHEVLRPGVLVRRRSRAQAGTLAWRLALGALLGGALAAQGAYALGHLALVPSSNYRQLTAMAELGQGRVFPFGAEPIGARVLLATAAELTPASHEDVVRFAGPMLASATIALVCLLLLRGMNRRDAALVATAVAVLGGLGGRLSVQEGIATGSVSQALALLLALGGVAIAMRLAASPTPGSLRRLTLAAIGVVLVHPPSLVILAPAVVAAASIVALRRRRLSAFLRVLAVVGVGAATGWLPVLAGRLAGAGRALPDGATPAASHIDGVLIAGPAAGALLALVVSWAALRAGRAELEPGIVLAVSVLGWAAIAYAGLPLSYFGPAELLVLVSMGVGLGLSSFRRRALVPLSVAVLAAVMSPGLSPQLPDLRHAVTEHDAGARAVSRELAGVTGMSYTVVGTPASLSRVVGRAWRVDLATFVRHLSLEQAADPGFTLPVPSDDVLLVAEIRPPVPRTADPAATRYAESEAEARAAVARQADEWMEVYARHHAGAGLLLDSDGVRVWSLRQTGDRAAAERFSLAVR